MEVSKINLYYLFRVELSSCELNLVLRETAMIDCDRYGLQQGRFHEVLSGVQSFLRNHSMNVKY